MGKFLINLQVGLYEANTNSYRQYIKVTFFPAIPKLSEN